MLCTCGTLVLCIGVFVAFGFRPGEAFDVRKLRNDNRLRHFGLLSKVDDEPEPLPPGGRHLDYDDNDDEPPYPPRIPYDRHPVSRYHSGRQPHRPPRDSADDYEDEEMFPIRKRYYVPAVSCDKSSGGYGGSVSGGLPKLTRAPRIIRRRSIPGDAVEGGHQRPDNRPPPTYNRPGTEPFRPGPPRVAGQERRQQVDEEHGERRHDNDGERQKVPGAFIDDLLSDDHRSGDGAALRTHIHGASDVNREENRRADNYGDEDDNHDDEDDEDEGEEKDKEHGRRKSTDQHEGRNKESDIAKDPKHGRPRNPLLEDMFELQRKLRYEGRPMAASRHDQEREYLKSASRPSQPSPLESQH